MTLMQNKGDSYTRQHTITTAGTPEHLGGYIVGATISFATNVISDSGSGFVSKGFKNGDKITVSGSTSNDGNYTVVTVAAGTLTLESGVVLTTEAASATVTITAYDRAINQEVPNGVKVLVRAHPDNTGTIYVGNSATTALSTSIYNQPLVAGQSINLQIQNLRNIWCDASTSADKVIYTFEY